LSTSEEPKESKAEAPEHKYGVSDKGIPLTKSGRENRSYHTADITKRKKVGRPKKSALKRPKGIIGRPKGDATIINEYKARMLASPKSAKVLEAIFNAALDDEHKHQASAWKLVMDRVAPTAAFEQEIIKGGGKSAIQINITGIGGASVVSQDTEDSQEDITDATYEVVP
tara:strand:- start:156 stop:665 length:510 start_codon:yes stop_codon:yes gene_type:complete